MRQNKNRGMTAKEAAAPTPHNHVSLILQQQAKAVRPMTIEAVVAVAVSTSEGSNH